MKTNLGVKIVLTASATEMSDFFNNPFIAFSAGFGLGPIPLGFARKSLYPPVERYPNGRAKYAPYGLRKVEAMLLENGFSSSDVAVAHPEDLANFVGPETKVIGISSMDPTGMGYVSKTYSSIIGGGEPMNALEFQKLVKHPSIKRFKPKIIAGGFGSWQLERKHMTDKHGIDCVLLGGRPDAIIDTFKKAVNNEPLPRLVQANESSTKWDYTTMPLSKHAAIHGAVEISKGCGRNCQFCTPTMQNKVDVPLDHIMQEVAMTTREGSDHITLITEDLFLYGSKDKRFVPNKEAVVGMVKSVAEHPGVKSIQVSHISLAPIVSNPQMIKELAEILIRHSWYSLGKKGIITAETGIETGSTRLMKKYMGGKMLPYKPDQWQEIVTDAFGILNDNDWYPLATLIVGLPDEKEKDVIETLELMDKLKGYKAFYVPLFFVPLENCVLMNRKGAELDSLSRARWDFFIRCWEYNIKIWKPTFLENRIRNPFVFKFINHVFIPCFAGVMGLYYGLTRGEQLKQAFWTLGMPQASAETT
ncbi:MAG: B12-binding domain-containing radical SAM protein [Candidatus Bathyarchaeota archaeon]|nr:B12-binding domain-containing radical SAM protein [Candidatus Bathyarchaeota archaeon]